jgi:Concanavalin A-like lectin/glucanases superfamily
MKTKKSSMLMKATVLFGTVLTISCGKDEVATLPAIGGYNSANDVATTNLVANWTFDGTNNERISGIAPKNTYGGVAFTPGVTSAGQALNLTAGALVYPSIPNLDKANALGSYTLSMWVNIKNNKTTFTSIFGIFPTAGTDVFGNLSAGAETGWFASSATADTLVLKANYKSLNADGSLNSQDNRPDPKGKPAVGVFKGAGVWSHFVIRFDATSNKLQVFGNGTSIGAYDDRGKNTVALNMQTPSQVVIGSLASSEIGFAQGSVLPSWTSKGTFALDNVRVYNKPLSDGDITSLYQLELAGR